MYSLLKYKCLLYSLELEGEYLEGLKYYYQERDGNWSEFILKHQFLKYCIYYVTFLHFSFYH